MQYVHFDCTVYYLHSMALVVLSEKTDSYIASLSGKLTKRNINRRHWLAATANIYQAQFHRKSVFNKNICIFGQMNRSWLAIEFSQYFTEHLLSVYTKMMQRLGTVLATCPKLSKHNISISPPWCSNMILDIRLHVTHETKNT